jgi:RNA polymerase sigma-70 factor (ECF subfamily)
MPNTQADSPGGADDQQHGGQLTSLSLLERARANDGEAWQGLVRLYEPLVSFWCRRAGLQGPDAEDLVQEVFAAAAAGLAGFRRDRPGDTFRGWLRGITRNQVMLHFRRSHGRPRAEGGSNAWQHLQDLPDPLSDATDEPAEVNQVYRRALELVRGEFAERTWQAFWLTVVEGREPAALTEELKITANSIRQAKSRVLRRLKQELGDILD